MITPFPYQITGKQFLLDNRACMLADEQGLGKTIQVILARNEEFKHGENTLIICPASVKYNWRVNFEKYGKDARIQVIDDGKTIVHKNTNILIVNYEYLHRLAVHQQILDFNASYIVIDEAHYLIGYDSIRTSTILGKKGKPGLLSQRVFRHVWLLTGTPMPNRPVDMYPVLRAFASKHLGTYADFRKYVVKFCGCQWNDYSANALKGASNLELLYKMIKPFYLRREKADVLPDLPEKFVNTVYFAPSEKIKQLESDIGTYREYLREGKDLSQTSTLRREMGVEKVNVTKSYIEGIDQPTILFYHHRTVGDVLVDMFPSAIRIDGKDNTNTKTKKIEQFKQQRNILIAQIGSVGTGVDGLQHVCNRAVFIEIPWAPGALGQAIDRLHRLGQTKDVHVELLILHKCFDENIYKSLIRKQRNIDRVIVATKEKETDMSIENSLERIAVALEKIAGTGSTVVAVGKTVADVIPTEATKATTASTKATTASTKATTASTKVDHAALRQEAIELSKVFMDAYQTGGHGDRKEGQQFIKDRVMPGGKNSTTCSTAELQQVISVLKNDVDTVIAMFSEPVDGAADDGDI